MNHSNRKKVVQALLSAAKVLARDLNRVDPKKFYVVVPIYENKDRQIKLVKDIARGVLDGVQGISDKSEIILNWYGMARNAIIVMDADKLMNMNKLSRVQYDNPHYLASDGLFALYRLWDKDPKRDGVGVATSFLQYASRGIGESSDHLFELGELGRKVGTYGWIFGKYIDNNRDQFKGLRSFAQHLRKALLSSKDVSPYKRKRLEAVPDKVWLSYVTNGFKNIGDVYKDEGEWLVKNRKLKIPKGSLLYVSDPLLPDIRRKLEKGELTEAEKVFVHQYSIKRAEEIDRAIEKYGFDKHYKVKRINDRKMEDAKKKFFIRQAERRR